MEVLQACVPVSALRNKKKEHQRLQKDKMKAKLKCSFGPKISFSLTHLCEQILLFKEESNKMQSIGRKYAYCLFEQKNSVI